MASLGNPKIWVPYMNTKDCSQGFCSLYCPQWCYVIFPPPPPPPPFGFPDDDSRPSFSPLVIAIIALLATAFLLMSYYAVIRKYFGKNESRRNQNHNPDGGLQENHDPSSSAVSVLHEPWHFVSTNGLDEALIKSITVCKYKKGDGLVEGTDCSVCLSEFEEDERLRLLPKCSHAFHLTCIDTWLKSHSNCPLCRASIVCGNASPSMLPLPMAETPQLDHESSSESEQRQNENLGIAEHLESNNNGDEEENQSCDHNVVSKSPLRVFSDLGNMERMRETVIEIREEGDQQTRRSVSMDYSRQVPSIADMLLLNQDEGTGMDEIDDGSSKPAMGESSSQSWHRNKGVLLHYVMNPVTMKRSFSSGKFFFKRHGRGRDPIIF